MNSRGGVLVLVLVVVAVGVAILALLGLAAWRNARQQEVQVAMARFDAAQQPPWQAADLRVPPPTEFGDPRPPSREEAEQFTTLLNDIGAVLQTQTDLANTAFLDRDRMTD